jgi:hypothetical protein
MNLRFVIPVLISLFMCSCVSLLDPGRIETTHAIIDRSTESPTEIEFSLEGNHGSPWFLRVHFFPWAEDDRRGRPLGSTSLSIRGELEITNTGDSRIPYPEVAYGNVQKVKNPDFMNPSEKSRISFILKDATLKNFLKIRLGEGESVRSLDYNVSIDLEPPPANADWHIQVKTEDSPATL